MTERVDVQRALLEWGLDRPLAHRELFAHRHKNKRGILIPPAPFHEDMQRDWASSHPFIVDKVFRGGAKSTTGEEGTILGALFEDFHYALVVSSNERKAMERVAAIRHEFNFNEAIVTLFGKQARWSVESDRELITEAGVKIAPLGRGQSLRGLKHLQDRPDFIWIDDIEDRKDISTPESRQAVWDWLTRDLLPALDIEAGRVRMSATPLHPEAVPERLERDPEVKVRAIPIMYRDLETGEWCSSWPDRFHIKTCLKLQNSYRRRGEIENFNQEYMVQAVAPEAKAFKQEMIKVIPQIRTWQAVYSMTDPARSVKATSATTGHAVWSWVNTKLVIWDAWAKKLMPSDIVDALFESHQQNDTTWVGVEEDGLNEWLLEPIRRKMAREGVMLPLMSLKAPQSKHTFIRGLQTFFKAGDVQFAKPLPELTEQLLGFPTGDIDAPNALAYALRLRPGMPIYEEFGPRNIEEDLRPAQGRTVWIVLNATASMVSGLACQASDGAVRVLCDVVREGDAGQVAADILTYLRLELGRSDFRIMLGPQHFDRFKNVGLLQAIKAIPMEARAGGEVLRGRAMLRRLLTRERQGVPMVLVGSKAKWTLNGFTSGYARAQLKTGDLADKPAEGVYKVCLESLETFAAALDLQDRDDDSGYHNAVTSDGRSYRSLLGSRGR